MIHDRSWVREKSWTKAIRKRRIDRETQPIGWNHDYYDNLHQYADNKIFCSCPLCRAKTKNKGKHRSFLAPTFNPSIRDKKRIDFMNEQEKELENE